LGSARRTGVQVRFLRARERERDGERQRERRRRLVAQRLLFSAHQFLSILIANANHLNCVTPAHLPVPRRVHLRVYNTRQSHLAALRALCHVCVRERERSRGSGRKYPTAETPGRSTAERTVCQVVCVGVTVTTRSELGTYVDTYSLTDLPFPGPQYSFPAY
jgi:hypothetical protein